MMILKITINKTIAIIIIMIIIIILVVYCKFQFIYWV